MGYAVKTSRVRGDAVVEAAREAQADGLACCATLWSSTLCDGHAAVAMLPRGLRLPALAQWTRLKLLKLIRCLIGRLGLRLIAVVKAPQPQHALPALLQELLRYEQTSSACGRDGRKVGLPRARTAKRSKA